MKLHLNVHLYKHPYKKKKNHQIISPDFSIQLKEHYHPVKKKKDICCHILITL